MMHNLISKKEEEERRLKALAEYRILGTNPESCYDDITKMAASICDVPISLMTLVDRDKQWFKSKVGLEIKETKRDWSFCTHAIQENTPLIIEDAFQDERFINNPLVVGDPKIRFYAGFPLKNVDGNKLGTLCVIDRKPGNLTPKQYNVMQLLSKQIVSFLELRKKSLNLLDALSKLHKQEGILSVCSYCREVKNKEGDWMHLEKYLTKISDIRFSHGVCDTCMEKHFPDVVEVWNKKDFFEQGQNRYLDS